MRRRRIRSGNAGRTWTISRSRRDRVWITWRLQNENLAQFSLGSPSGSSSVDSFQNIGRTLYATSELAASLVAPSCSRCWLAADAFEKLRYSKVIYPFVAATFLPINLPREEEEGTKVYLYVCACMCVCVCVCKHEVFDCMCEFTRTWPTERRRISRSIFYPAWKRYGE